METTNDLAKYIMNNHISGLLNAPTEFALSLLNIGRTSVEELERSWNNFDRGIACILRHQQD